MARVSFRPMTVHDLADVVRWRSEPHLLRWFDDLVPDVHAALQRYGPRLEGRTAVRMSVALLDGVPVGFCQHFPVASHDDIAVKVQDPRAVAFDYLLGEPSLLGRGWGAVLVETFCREVLVPQCPDAPRFVALADARNRRSLRVLKRCGFSLGLWVQLPTSDFAEIVCTAPRERFEASVDL
ncbi:MAG: GNAT family N-acetyltransferase [Actinomycetales bacterium]|nr:MAG: GNAT family N-acetyltransferase [Actinomycetales bacterium]